MRKTFVETLTKLSRQDEKVMCVIGDTGFSVFEEYEKEFGDRFVNVGIAEQNFIGFGAGLAAMGMRPFLYNVASFMWYRAFEQIEFDICYQENPVILVGVGGGHAYGPAGPSHHAGYDLAMASILPNMQVFCPADPVEMREVMLAAYESRKPAYIRIGRSVDPVIHRENVHFDIGKAIRMREGRDTVLVATGTVVKDAIKTADILESNGISCALYSMPSIKPLDDETVALLGKEFDVIFSAEEHSVKGGLGDAIQESLRKQGLNTRVIRFGFPDTFAPVTGSRDYLNGLYGIDSESMARTIKERIR